MEQDKSFTEQAREHLETLGLSAVLNNTHVVWNPRMRSAAGRAFLREQRIELNPKLRSLENAHDEIQRTFFHELAHLVTHARHPRRRIEPHGAEWQLACAQLGIPNERATHRLPLPRHQQKREHIYQCSHCQTLVERVRPIKRPSACALCCRNFNSGVFSKKFLLVKLPTS